MAEPRIFKYVLMFSEMYVPLLTIVSVFANIGRVFNVFSPRDDGTEAPREG